MTITYTYNGGLYVNMTNRCSNSCYFCVRNEDSCIYGSDNLWLDREPTLEETFSDIRGRGLENFSELVFCGYGEPTYRLDDIFEICDRVRKISDISIRINTNGQASLIAGKDVSKEFRGRFNVVSISLNATNAQDYQKVCNSEFGEEAFGEILRFAKSVSECVDKVILSVVETTISDKDIEICKKIAIDCGAELRVREFIG